MAETDPIRSIVIAGGGTAGWMAAAALARRFERHAITVTVVESSAIGTVGVGEATVPGIRDFFRDLGISGSEVMQATNGTVKLGIAFEGWRHEGHRFFHPFGLYGAPSRGVQFHQFWIKMRAAGHETPLADYCLCTELAENNLFMPPPEAPRGDLGIFDWAVHFDASLFARFLARRAKAAGVTHIDAKIEGVNLDGESGRIASLALEDGRTIAGDLFIDCTGFRGLLLGQALGIPYVDWTDILPCDRAVAMPCVRGGELTPYTRSTARSAGWQWRIPLQSRVGNGYVYCSRHISDDEAVATLRANLEGEALAEPHLIRFTTGKRERLWAGNCVALGLAGGFLEPLESTSITVIQTGIERLIEFFPDRNFDPLLAEEYNRIADLEYERIRDFLLLHYWGNQRHGEPMWDQVRAQNLPEPLAYKVALWKARGRFVRYQWESFLDPSWLSLYAGLGIFPEAFDPSADFFSVADLDDAFAKMREAIGRARALAVPHEQFIAANCRSQA
jgi:tryptophan halogenase